MQENESAISLIMAFHFHLHFLFLVISFPCTIAKVKSSRHFTRQMPDSYILSCGASKHALDESGRNWTPDYKFLPSNDNSIASKAEFQDPSLPSVVPYMTARIFKSQSTYTFPVSPKDRHWIRLHFYPNSYNNHDSSNALFSVNAGEYTLLKDFSVYQTSMALTQAYIVREFSIVPVPSGTLNLTFTPTSTNNNSFAFVNGIELLSMPEIFRPTPMVGVLDHLMEVEFSTLQTMFRLNVGGQYIQGSNDPELSRTWYDDTPFLFGAGAGVTFQGDNNLRVRYSHDVEKFIAPLDVYKTARSMGPDGNVNKNYNLTWIFKVDLNFTYLVRFHFCELQFSKVNQRVFDVFINNQTAIQSADVIAFSGGKGLPAYRDYTVYVKDNNNGDDNLWIALHPNVTPKPQYYDAILNGLEIFKINDTKGNLAGPNPQPSVFSQIEIEQKKSFTHPKSHHDQVIGVTLGALAGLGLCVGVFAIIVRSRKRGWKKGRSSSDGWFSIYGSSNSSGAASEILGRSGGATTVGSLCRYFSLGELKRGTNNFDEAHVVGVGGFGKVFKGVIDRSFEVAIKRANPSSDQGVNEFRTEIDLLSKLRHRHLVSLIGACEENNEMILVYDYMANGTLREHLYGTNNPTLSWKKRLDICIGAARGLHYLHTGAKCTIIHRDVKTTNILLDEKWVAKVSDFGLSKIGTGIHQTHVSTVVKGSFGYLDPEYFKRQRLTDKSDVYSFGVVLFEVLCGRPPIDNNLPREQSSLADWAHKCYIKGNLVDIIDPLIREEINDECLRNFAETAAKCLSDHGLDRPSMGSVLWNLEYALQLQANPNEPPVVAEQKANDAYTVHETHLYMEDTDSGDHSVTSRTSHTSHASQTESGVFSQIFSLKGR